METIENWYLREWLAFLNMKQVTLIQRTGWDKRKTSELVSGKQRYNQDCLNEAARALGVRPYELLIEPEEALALGRLRESAMQIAAETRSSYRHGPDFSSSKDHQSFISSD